MNIVAARTGGGKLYHSRIRDAFLTLPLEAKKQLNMAQKKYITMPDHLVVVGDGALQLANVFRAEIRRPLAKGVIAAGELEGQEVLNHLLNHVTQGPLEAGEHCYYSVPAAPVDVPDSDVVYHTEVFRSLLSKLGFTPHPCNEAMGVIYAACAPSFSGIAISFGSGMANVALAYETMEALSFSLARGGDWIDARAAQALGRTAPQVCALKEKGLDLAKPVGREQEAIAVYVRALMVDVIQTLVAQLQEVRSRVTIPEAIPIVLSGGTTLCGHFAETFAELFEPYKGKLGIEVSEVRVVPNPMTAVAEGLLLMAHQEYDPLQGVYPARLIR